MADAEPLSITDAESVYNAVLQLIIDYPYYPSNFKASHKTVTWNSIGDGISIGLFPLQGAIYIRRYISGSYIAQFPFQICFKSNPTANKAMISAQELVDDIAKWMEKCGIGFKDEKVVLEGIHRMTPAFPLNQTDTYTEFAVNMQLIYSHKK